MLEYKGKAIDWRRKATKIVSYELIGLAAILVAIGMIIVLWATYWMVITRNVQNLYQFFGNQKGLNFIPFLEIIISPKKLTLLWLGGATIILVGTVIARKELGPDE